MGQYVTDLEEKPSRRGAVTTDSRPNALYIKVGNIKVGWGTSSGFRWSDFAKDRYTAEEIETGSLIGSGA